MVQRIFALFLASWLLFIMTTYSFGAILPVSSPFQLGDSWYTKTDSWYSINNEKPKVNIYAKKISPDFSIAGGEYYQNDQTFFDLFSQDINKSNLTYLGGSYLFDSGLFVGLNYLKTATITETLLSPGYRFKLKDNGYLALSFDYLAIDDSDIHDIVSYDVNFKLFPKKMKIYGEIYLPKEGNDTVVNLGANYEVSKGLVVGADYMSQGSQDAYSAGLTYKVQSLIIDAALGKNFTQNYYQFAATENLKNFSMGALYQKYQNDPDPMITVQGKYHLTKADLILKYTFKNDSYNQVTALAYERRL